MITGATLFSGGELVGVGMRSAGIEHLWGIEIDDAIADVARMNGFHTITADILKTDPATLPVPDVLHASPICTNASVANQGAGETDLDLAFGDKIAEYIDVMTPKVFTLENVFTYRNFEAFGLVIAALERHGYMYDFANVNSADFGVPQTRRRLILRAVRGALLPPLPPPVPWVGWYEAIEDLVPGLPETQFAKWQLMRLQKLTETVFITGQYNQPSSVDTREPQQLGVCVPAKSVTAQPHNAGRAFILSSAKTEFGDGVRQDDEPVHTVTEQSNGRTRAWLVAQGGYDGNVVNRQNSEPSFTVTANNNQNNGVKAWLTHGRVVKMTPRALARFQSVPDDYILPDKAALACKIIGNGVPCLMMQKIYERLTEVTR